MNSEEKKDGKSWVRRLGTPIFIFFSGIAVLGIFFQIFLPDPYIQNQEQFQSWLLKYRPYDVAIFVGVQALQVIIAPISHYTVGLAGGFMYGAVLGGLYNYVGRMIGHVAAYWIGRSLQGFIRKIFNPDDYAWYQKFVVGTEKTLWIRLLILFLMIFLPLFPDDELSYLVGLAGLRFRYYFPVLLLGHIGGSWGLAYIGAAQIRDPVFFGLLGFAFLLTLVLIVAVRRLGRAQ